MINFLLEKGVDISSQEKDGSTCLHFTEVQPNNPQGKARCSGFRVSVLIEKAIDGIMCIY